MGGKGSTRWGRTETRPTTESMPALDVRRLARAGQLEPGRVSSITWNQRGAALAAVDIRAEVDRLAVVVTTRGRGEDGGWGRCEVGLTKTSCTLGGARPWFLCPGCARRVAVLYAASARLRCRACLGLVYLSQREDPVSRLVRRTDRAGERLGLKKREPWVSKPHRMRWRTFWRLMDELEQAALAERAAIARRRGLGRQ